MSLEYFAALPEEDVLSSRPVKCVVDGLSILVARDDSGKIFAFENNCSHADKPLERGSWNPETREMVCPFHKAVFDVGQNGLVKVGPAILSLRIFQTEIRKHHGRATVFVAIDTSE